MDRTSSLRDVIDIKVLFIHIIPTGSGRSGDLVRCVRVSVRFPEHNVVENVCMIAPRHRFDAIRRTIRSECAVRALVRDVFEVDESVVVDCDQRVSDVVFVEAPKDVSLLHPCWRAGNRLHGISDTAADVMIASQNTFSVRPEDVPCLCVGRGHAHTRTHQKTKTKTKIFRRQKRYDYRHSHQCGRRFYISATPLRTNLMESVARLPIPALVVHRMVPSPQDL